MQISFFCLIKYILITFEYFVWIYLSSRGNIVPYRIWGYHPHNDMKPNFRTIFFKKCYLLRIWKIWAFFFLKIWRLLLCLKIHALISASMQKKFFDKIIWKVVIVKKLCKFFLIVFSVIYDSTTGVTLCYGNSFFRIRNYIAWLCIDRGKWDGSRHTASTSHPFQGLIYKVVTWRLQILNTGHSYLKVLCTDDTKLTC